MAGPIHRWPALSQGLAAPGEQQQAPAELTDEQRQQLFAQERQRGYDAGMSAAQQAAAVEYKERLATLDTSIAQVQQELQDWQLAYRERFHACAEALLHAIGVGQAALAPNFYTNLLAEASAFLEVERDSLHLEIAADLAQAVSATAGVSGLAAEHGLSPSISVVAGLAPGEMRLHSGASVAQLDLQRLVRESLTATPQMPEPEPAPEPAPAEQTGSEPEPESEVDDEA